MTTTTRARLQHRARLYQRIRAFFSARDFLEVDTPLLDDATNTDVNIEPVSAWLCGHRQYLQSSPEFAMKRLLAEGSGSIWQICHAFRDEEQGRYHRGEFSLLEWYSVGFDYQQLMDQLEALLGEVIEAPPSCQRIRYADAFRHSLGLDIFQADTATLRHAVAQNISGIDEQTLSSSDCLDLLMSEVVSHDFDGFVLVYDYPADQASLARISSQDPRVAERFELFYKQLELANGFSELTDAQEQRSRFEHDNAKRRLLGRQHYPLDEKLLAALEQGLPQCAGVALGLDRLLMVMLSAGVIDDVMTL